MWWMGIPKQVVEAFPHFARRFIRESDRKNLVRQDALPNEVIDASGKDAGFPGTGSREDTNRAVGRKYGFLLLFVKSLEVLHLATIPH